MRLLLPLVCLCACASPIVRGEHGYAVPESHYVLAPLDNGEMTAPGGTLAVSNNRAGEPDFGFPHAYGKSGFFLVHGLPLRGDEPALPLPDLARRWRDQLAVFGLHYGQVFIPDNAGLAAESDPEPVPGVKASTRFELHYVWERGSYDLYIAILRDPARDGVVVVMCGNEAGSAFESAIPWAEALTHRVRFDP